jgi:hypothetical protein
MLPNNALSSTVLSAPFLAPRAGVRFDAAHGLTDTHLGGIALGDASAGISYQLWTARADGANVYLSAPNTPEFPLLANVNAAWVALAIDQSAREFVAYADINGNASYYWYDTTILAYRTSALAGVIPRVFAALDDSRPLELGSSDVILAYERAGHLYYRQQRDRFGTEYDLGSIPGIAPSTLVQIGMNAKLRFQFAFQGVQIAGLPPGEILGAAA